MKQNRERQMKSFKCRLDKQMLEQFAAICKHNNVYMTNVVSAFIKDFITIFKDETLESLSNCINNEKAETSKSIEEVLGRIEWMLRNI